LAARTASVAVRPGRSQPSFDKQFVRDYLKEINWNEDSPPPALPEHIVQNTRDKYIEIFEIITRKKFGQ
jgi:phosphoribosylaminoimidazole-succinocarboxamide synthase